MKTIALKLPELGLFAITRIALGAGVGLLAGRCLSESERRGAGAALLLVGLLTTVPFAVKVFSADD